MRIRGSSCSQQKSVLIPVPVTVKVNSAFGEPQRVVPASQPDSHVGEGTMRHWTPYTANVRQGHEREAYSELPHSSR